jgi:fatty acid desaturase
MGHNYHAVHHLWPTIPWHAYIARYKEKIDYLRENDVPIENRLIGGRLYPTRRDAGGTPVREDAQQSEA